MTIYFEKTAAGSLDFIQSNLKEYFSIFSKINNDLYHGADVSISGFIGDIHKKDYFFKKNKFNVLIQPIDGTVIKPEFVELINKFNLVITPGNIGKDIMVSNGVQVPIEVIPNFYKDYDIKARRRKSTKIVFYHESTLIPRKNFTGMYKEFLSAFANEEFFDRVKLLIKTASSISEYSEFIRATNEEYEFIPEIEIISEHMSEIELAHLWQQADCYISLSHMEGFGIPLLNFAALGKPIITLRSSISGYMDFLNDDNCYFVDSRQFTIGKDNLIFSGSSMWEDVDNSFEPCSNILQNVVADLVRGKCRTVSPDDIRQFRFEHVQKRYLTTIFGLAGEGIPDVHENPLTANVNIKEREYEVREIDKGTWPENWPVCGQPVYWEKKVAPQPVHLYINYYIRPERQRELDKCLIKNIKNKLIDRVFVAVEPGTTLPVSDPKITIIEYEPDPTTGYHSSLSFKKWFDLALENSGPNVIKIVCNSDIYFDNTLSILKIIDMTGKCFALSRWNENTNGSIELFDCIGSQDAWIFTDNITVTAPFGMGIPGCDQKIARELHDKGIEVSNPCKTIRCIHVHMSQLRWWKYPLHSLGEDSTIGIRHGEIRFSNGDKPRLAILGLAKNCGHSMNKLLESMRPIFDKFDCVGWVSCADRTSANFLNNTTKYPIFVLPDIKYSKDDNRYSHLAKLRNLILNTVKTSAFNPDYYLIIDMDVTRMVDCSGIDKLISNSDWSAISVLGLMPYNKVRSFHIGPKIIRDEREYVYYDTLALETKDKTRYIWSTAGQWYSHGTGFDPNTIFKTSAPPLNFNSWEEVNSAFGPATFYRASAFDNLNYSETVKQCEHQDLHARMQGKHFIANDLIWEY